MSDSVFANAASYVELGVFSWIALTAAWRALLHVKVTFDLSRCGAPFGFHLLVLGWTATAAVSAFLYVQPYDTEIPNLILDTITSCVGITVRTPPFRCTRRQDSTRNPSIHLILCSC